MKSLPPAINCYVDYTYLYFKVFHKIPLDTKIDYQKTTFLIINLFDNNTRNVSLWGEVSI